MDSVRSGPFGQIFRPDNFIFGQVSCQARTTVSNSLRCLWDITLQSAIESFSIPGLHARGKA